MIEGLADKCIVFVDVETRGLRPELGETAFAAATFNTKTGKIKVYFPNEDEGDRRELMAELEQAEVIANHNVPFDIRQMMRSWGAPTGLFFGKPWVDTQGWDKIFSPWAARHGLKVITAKLQGLPQYEDPVKWLRKNAPKGQKRNYELLPREILVPYVASDVARAHAVYRRHLARYQNMSSAQAQEMSLDEDLAPVLLGMTLKGVRISTSYLKEARIFFETQLERVRKQIPFNYRSRLAMIEFYRPWIEKFRLYKDGDPNRPSIDKYGLSLLIRNQVPFAEQIRQARIYDKLLGTYVASWEEWAEHGRIHTTFKQHTVRTTRLSSGDPNIQNVPPEMRRVVIPDDEDHRMVCVDWRQMELMAAAYLSGDKGLIEALHDDIHSVGCKALFGKLTPELRKVAKEINFSVLYGAGPRKVAQTLNVKAPKPGGAYWTVAEAGQLLSRFWDKFPGLGSWSNMVMKFARQDTPVTDPFGHHHYPDPIRKYSLTNYVIQGFCARVCKEAMRTIARAGLDIRIQVHDDIVVMTHKNDVDEVVQVMTKAMTHVGEFAFPVEVKVCENNWKESTSLGTFK